MAAKTRGASKPTAKATGTSKVTLNMPLDAKKAAAIQRCLKKGALRVTLNKVDLATGRLGDGWLYD